MLSASEILVIGGGKSGPRVIEGLKFFQSSILLQGGVPMTDNGGRTGELRKKYPDLVALGDLRRYYIPLAKNTLAQRFEETVADNQAYGNVYLLDLWRENGNDVGKMVEVADKELDVIGSPIPTTLESAHLVARLESGREIFGETDIDVPKETGGRFERIEEIWLTPKGTRANPRFIEAILKAKIIVLCPGDFYSSILAALLPNGIMQAFRRTKAKVVFIAPLMTKWGETWRYTLDDLMSELTRYIGGDVIHSILMNSTEISREMRDGYAREHSEPMLVGIRSPYQERVWFAPLLQQGVREARHDSKLIGEAFSQLFPEYFYSEEAERMSTARHG